jgi:hypothetical protein
MSRLSTIVSRQRRYRTRDLMFAAFVVLATAIGVSSVAGGPQASIAAR